MNYFFYIFFAVLPSIIWLVFYLRQDQRPEPKRMVFKIFIYGMIAAFLTIILQSGFIYFYNPAKANQSFLSFIIYSILGIAFLEEFLKYLVVRISVLRDPEFDEPYDALLYLIISGLGFAALENLLLFLRLGEIIGPEFPTVLQNIALASLLRAVTATFLHALCGGILGFFVALSFYKTRKKNLLLIAGLALVTFLHAFYNFSIISMGAYIITAIILISMVLLLYAFILKIKKLPSICK